VCSVAIWFLMAMPLDLRQGKFNQVAPGDSVFGALAGLIAPVFGPAGFGSWEASGALLTGFVAKEVVVSTLSQVYVGEPVDAADDSLRPSLRDDVREILVTFKDAGLLTAQEVVNIGPRTLNLLPLVQVPQANWVQPADQAAASSSSTSVSSSQGTFERALVGAFARTAGTDNQARWAAVAFNVFVLLYVPCMVAVAAMRQEFGGRWTLAQVGYTLLLAWLAAVLVYQGGLLLGIGL
jgi:ferrous iron transport protein B